jgi:hypothetical protein
MQQTKKQSIFDKIRESCETATKMAKYVKINEMKLQHFATEKVLKVLSGNPDYFKKMEEPTAMPIKFDNEDQEINFRVLYAALQFGSGYRKELHKHCGRGAAETMTYGLISMYLETSKLDAEFMAQFRLFDVEQYFRIPVQVEQAHKNNPLLKVGVDSELKPLADGVRFTMNDCARVLMELQHKDFASFIKATVKEDGSANHLVSELVKRFPVFDDKGLLHDKKTEVYLFKKAQLVAAELYKNIREQNPMFNFPDINNLTVYVDNVIPACLVKDGILELEESLHKKIQEGTNIARGPLDTEIRAVALLACEKILDFIGRDKINALQLDYFLWSELGKQEEYRKFERHATKDVRLLQPTGMGQGMLSFSQKTQTLMKLDWRSI